MFHTSEKLRTLHFYFVLYVVEIPSENNMESSMMSPIVYKWVVLTIY